MHLKILEQKRLKMDKNVEWIRGFQTILIFTRREVLLFKDCEKI